MNKDLSLHLITIAYRLTATGDELDAQAAAFILKAEKEARRTSGQRVPRIVIPKSGGQVKVKLKCGAVGYVPAEMVRDALEETP